MKKQEAKRTVRRFLDWLDSEGYAVLKSCPETPELIDYENFDNLVDEFIDSESN